MDKIKANRPAPNRIRRARLQAGIATQRELAELTGLHPSIISGLERSKRRLNATWALKIGQATGTDWLELFDPVKE